MVKNRAVWRWAEACAFLLLLAIVLVLLTGVLEQKRSRDLFSGFFEEPQAYDVLFLGDSQFMNGMMPLEMWEDYGIPAYNLSCYGDKIPTMFWVMINALDYASPRLVVLAINSVNDPHKVTKYSEYLHTALDFWPLSVNKIRMIQDLLNDPENPGFTDADGRLFEDLRWEYIFTLGKYHSRWSELGRDDFSKGPVYAKGGEALVDVTPIWEYDLVDEDNYADEGGYGYAYLRRTIEECQRRGIDVLLVHLPAPEYINSQRHANTVGSVATEYGVDFIDVTRLDSIVDYAVDCYDGEPHLNASGTLKMTSYLGSYIAKRYGLPDRRSEADYAHWQAYLDAYQDAKLETILQQETLNNVLMLLHDQDFDMRMAVRSGAPMYYDELSILLTHNMAREHVLAGEEYEKWSNMMYPLEAFDKAVYEDLSYYMQRQNGKTTESAGAEAEKAAQALFAGDETANVMVEIIDRRNGRAATMRF